MAPRRGKKWKGGYIRINEAGSTYIIERRINGHRIHVSTRCRTKEGALEQLKRFEADPFGYTPAPEPAERLLISEGLVTEYATWMRDVKRNTSDWIDTVCRMLGDWREDLGDKDLREISIQQDLKPALQSRKSRRHRIEAIKAFCTWLRREKGLLTMAEDRTVDLPVPPSIPAKTKRRRAVSRADVGLVLAKLAQGKRRHIEASGQKWYPRPPSPTAETCDVMLLQLGTAWHISEVRRFAESGEIVRPPGGSPLAVLVTKHKSGELTRTPLVAQEHLRAAERIRARGAIPIRETLVEVLKWACEAVREDQARAMVPERDRLQDLRLGVMRHSVLTWAVELGASPEDAARFAGHRSSATTKRFYLDVAVPTVSVPLARFDVGLPGELFSERADGPRLVAGGPGSVSGVPVQGGVRASLRLVCDGGDPDDL